MFGLFMRLLFLVAVVIVSVLLYRSLKRLSQGGAVGAVPLNKPEECPACGKRIRVGKEPGSCPKCGERLGRGPDGKLLIRLN